MKYYSRHQLKLFWITLSLVVGCSATKVFSQNVGIGTAAFIPVNLLDVKGNAVIGSTYSGVNVAPANGLLVEGNTGIGTVAPIKKLDVRGDIQVGDPVIWSSAAQDRIINFGDPNYVYIGERGADDRMELRGGRFYFNVGNVGIGTALASERLDVVGNVKFSGALMPNNLAGNVGQVLKSAGAGAAPVWGPQMNGITAVEKWYLGPQNFNANTTYTFTVTGVTGCDTYASVVVNLNGEWATQPNVTIHHVEARNGEIKFRISNNTLLTNYIGMDFNILVIR